jgi:hypothetical protein
MGTLLKGLSMPPFFSDGDILPTRLVSKNDTLKIGDVVVFWKN